MTSDQSVVHLLDQQSAQDQRNAFRNVFTQSQVYLLFKCVYHSPSEALSK